MKKIRTTITVMIMIIAMLASSLPSFAFGPNETRSIDAFFAETQILKGSGGGYGLDQPANRLEGIVILLRLMGKEAESQAMAGQTCRFKDVPNWAKGYVNYAYAENISKGVSATKFGVSSSMSANQYNTLMLRTLGYDDGNGDFSWDDAVSKAEELSILPGGMAQDYFSEGAVFTKGDLMDTSFCYLEASYKNQEQTMIQRLMANGVISEEEAREYGLTTDSWDGITTNLNDEEQYSLKMENGIMTVTGKSTANERKWLLVRVTNKKTGEDVTTKAAERDANGNFDFHVTLNNLQKGEYYISLYGNSEEYNTYLGITIYEIILKKTLTEEVFVPAPVYGENLRIFKGCKIEQEDVEISPYVELDAEAIQKIKDLSAEITKDCDNDYEKVRAVHDWVAEYLYYDEDFYSGKYTAESLNSETILENRYAVCSGYSILCKDLLSAAGIPCKLAYGYAIGESSDKGWPELDLKNLESNHVWNEAYADGRWIIFDATWDSMNSYISESFSKGKGSSNAFFDCSLEYFSLLHKEIE